MKISDGSLNMQPLIISLQQPGGDTVLVATTRSYLMTELFNQVDRGGLRLRDLSALMRSLIRRSDPEALQREFPRTEFEDFIDDYNIAEKLGTLIE